jgi:cellulose synthase/poly-beta-1,6-N-acetylglucosamine synthase-like glycosyltransferase
MEWIVIFNYAAWFVFVFIGVVWILVMLQNNSNVSQSRKPLRFPKVSVLIPAFNEEETIGKTIQSVLDIEYPEGKKEVIVINDSSTDKTREIVESFGDKVRLLNNKKNRGKAYSLNRAIKISRGEFIACIDADSVVEGNILNKMVGYFEDEEIACVTPALKVWKSPSVIEKIQYAEYLLNVFLRKMLAFMDSIHVTPGVFSIYRKSVLEEAGGFDVGNLTEDMEIALKIHELGYKIENDFNAVSYTICPTKWGELFRQRIRWYRGALNNTVKYKHMIFNRKYGNLGVFFLPVNFIAIFAIISVFFLTGYNLVNLTMNSAWKLSLIGWDMGVLMKNFDVYIFLSNLVTTPVIIGVLGLIIGTFIMYKSFNLNKTSIRENKPGCFVFLLVYPFIMMAFWSLALIHEMLRLQKKW